MLQGMLTIEMILAVYNVATVCRMRTCSSAPDDTARMHLVVVGQGARRERER